MRSRRLLLGGGDANVRFCLVIPVKMRGPMSLDPCCYVCLIWITEADANPVPVTIKVNAMPAVT
jgi:hypothetical protein